MRTHSIMFAAGILTLRASHTKTSDDRYGGNVGLIPILWNNPARSPVLDRPRLAGDDRHAKRAFATVGQPGNLGPAYTSEAEG